MKMNIVLREYSFSDAVLVTTANGIISTARRDAVEFGKRNYTESKDFTPITNQIDAFQNIPTDEEMEGIEIDQTAKKNASKEVVKSKIRHIMSAAKNIWGDKSGKYKRFGTKGLDDFDDANILHCAARVARTATLLLTDLAAEGIVAATITSLKDAGLGFESKINLQLDAIHDRNETKEIRVLAGNDLYRKIVKVANVGKNIWAETSEAKYNDYIIYDRLNSENGGDPNTPPSTTIPTTTI